MTLEIDFVATHEAGHAVMQWLVGREPGEIVIGTSRLTLNERPESNTLTELRKRLLVVFAGGSLTLKKWPDRKGDYYDWQNAAFALSTFLGYPTKLVGGNVRKFQDEKAIQLSQDAIDICKEIVNHDLFQLAIDQMVKRLLELEPDGRNTIKLAGSETVSICEAYIGKEFQAENQWSDWMDGR